MHGQSRLQLKPTPKTEPKKGPREQFAGPFFVPTTQPKKRMKKLNMTLLCLGVLALASCKDEEPKTAPETNYQQELEEWQARAESEFQKRQKAEAETITASTKARSLEKAVLATGVAAVGFLFIGGALGSKAKRDVLQS